MLKTRIIPCLDVNEGRVVKGVNFVDLIDAGDPVEQAKIYDEQGADELCFLDITATSSNRETIFEVVRHTAEEVFIPLTVGGGVRTLADIRKLLEAGADKIGHLGFFRSRFAETLWPQFIAWLLDGRKVTMGGTE